MLQEIHITVSELLGDRQLEVCNLRIDMSEYLDFHFLLSFLAFRKSCCLIRITASEKNVIRDIAVISIEGPIEDKAVAQQIVDMLRSKEPLTMLVIPLDFRPDTPVMNYIITAGMFHDVLFPDLSKVNPFLFEQKVETAQ